MPRTVPKPSALTNAQARRIWLRAQRLDEREPFGAGAEAVAAAVKHLGYVQIDTINVIERCHHHILFSRIPAYRRADLKQAQTTDKSVFEYWAHALAYLPTETLRHFVVDMKHLKREPGRSFSSVQPKDLRKVLRLVKRDGALTIRDIEEEPQEKLHLWASRKPSKRVLEYAFYLGALTISERNGMVKTYELMSRHFGWDKPPKAASVTETTAYVLDRALSAQGLVSLDSICHLDAPRKAAVGKLIGQRVRRGELVPVALEGAGKQEHWARPDVIGASGEATGPGLVHILSPFDPLVIQRKRTRLFFGYDHKFEAYLPKEKRQFGYFALPVLVGDRIVAALDLKTDRQSRKLLIQKWTWVGDGAKKSVRKELKRSIEEELDRFEKFQLGD
jgi:uncharacterized protein YcaQ